MRKFDFETATENQKEAIQAWNEPLLIIAGPGTGKTFTLKKRVAWLLLEKGVSPGRVLITTFTEKAATELKTKISLELEGTGMNTDDIWIGTVHSICKRILEESDFNINVIDQSELQHKIYMSNHPAFAPLQPEESEGDKKGAGALDLWRHASKIADRCGALLEELAVHGKGKEFIQALKRKVNPDDIKMHELLNWVDPYLEILQEAQMMDFSHLQIEALKHIRLNPEWRNRFDAILVDEYQDTNHIQDSIIMGLAGDHPEIVSVVGDDDQALYRFRQASIDNILLFEKHYGNKTPVKKVYLDQNFRSNQKIVDFCNQWISNPSKGEVKKEKNELGLHTHWSGESTKGSVYRHEKSIYSAVKDEKQPEQPAVFWIQNSGLSLYGEIAGIVKNLQAAGLDFSNIVFLFHSVKSPHARALANFLESQNIPVYSPRSESFFDREEISLMLGVLALQNEQEITDEKFAEYLRQSSYGEADQYPVKSPDESLLDYFYRILGCKSFHEWMNAQDTDYPTRRIQENLAILSAMIKEYELKEKDSANLSDFLSEHIYFVWKNGTREQEEEDITIPTGCVGFLTNHQAKGLEFPVVFVENKGASKKWNGSRRINQILDEHLGYSRLEKDAAVNLFDLTREYYVAYTRAKDILILTTNVKKRPGPQNFFFEDYKNLPSLDKEYSFENYPLENPGTSKPVRSYSYTSQISVYDFCPWLYEKRNVLNFADDRVSEQTEFGIVVHKVLNALHKHAAKNPNVQFLEEDIRTLITKYKNEKEFPDLDPDNICNQVMKYIEGYQGNWPEILRSEEPVSVVAYYRDSSGVGRPFIFKGVIDCIQGDKEGVTLLDFKTKSKLDPHDPIENAQLRYYKDQLILYAHLLESQGKERVKKLRIHFLEDGSTYEFPYRPSDGKRVFSQLAGSVERIESGKFERPDDNRKCPSCSFKWVCSKIDPSDYTEQKTEI